MKKQWICGYAALLVVVLAAGCARQPSNDHGNDTAAQSTKTQPGTLTETQAAKQTEALTRFPTKYTKEAGSIHFNTEVMAGEDGTVKELSVYQVQPLKVNHDDIYNRFFAQKELKDKQILDRKNEDGSAGTAYYYHGKQGENLSILETGFHYYSPFAFQLLNSFSLEKGQDGYNADLYQKGKDFAFLDHSGALKQVLDQMNTFGLKLEDGAYESQNYSLDYQTMKKEETILDMNGNKDTKNYKAGWSEADNCYYFCIRQKIDGIPVTYEYAGAFAEYDDANAPVQAMVSKDGIQMLTLDKLFQITDTSKKASLLDFEQIAKCIENKYGDLLTKSSYNVNRAELVYIALKQQQGGYEMKPVWVFDITEKAEGAKSDHLLQMTVDAQTGEEVIL